MIVERSPHSFPPSHEGVAEKPPAAKLNSVRGQSQEFPEKDFDSQPSPDSPLPNGLSTDSAIEPDDYRSLRSMANGTSNENLDQEPKSLAPPSETNLESALPPSEVKSESYPLEATEETIPGEQGRGPDATLANNGTFETPLADNSTNTEASPEKQSFPSPGAQDETEASVNAGKTCETTTENTRSTEEGTEVQVDASETQDFPGETQQLSVPRGVEEELEVSANAGQMKETVAVAESPSDVVSGQASNLADENPELLTSLPPVKKSVLRNLPTRRVKDEELKEKVVIPGYLSKGMIDAIESAGVANIDDPRIVNVVAPESPLMVFINSKSGGRLGPELEALLVDLISSRQVYDLSKCKPIDVLRYGLGYLEKQADAGDNTALRTRNNLRIMVAGGDGTVGWVLGCIASSGLKGHFKVPPVGVIPLGTGNDLSRSFRWGGSTTSISRRAVKWWLMKATEASIAKLDSWHVVLKPAPSRKDASVALPPAMYPVEDPSCAKEETSTTPYFDGSFWNYFSLGMDAQVAYGFHHLRNEAPWIASGRLSNQMVYGGYGCAQGWFCTPCAAAPVARGLRRIVKVSTKSNHDVDTQWDELVIPPSIRAIIILNLQSYAGGRNPWGHPSSGRREKEGFVEAKCDDGVLEIVGLTNGWQAAVVLLDWLTAVRLGQARAVKLELTGKGHRLQAYMQMDGEPWQQPLGEESDPPAVVEISSHPGHSLCLLRK